MIPDDPFLVSMILVGRKSVIMIEGIEPFYILQDASHDCSRRECATKDHHM